MAMYDVSANLGSPPSPSRATEEPKPSDVKRRLGPSNVLSRLEVRLAERITYPKTDFRHGFRPNPEIFRKSLKSVFQQRPSERKTLDPRSHEAPFFEENNAHALEKHRDRDFGRPVSSYSAYSPRRDEFTSSRAREERSPSRGSLDYHEFRHKSNERWSRRSEHRDIDSLERKNGFSRREKSSPRYKERSRSARRYSNSRSRSLSRSPRRRRQKLDHQLSDRLATRLERRTPSASASRDRKTSSRPPSPFTLFKRADASLSQHMDKMKEYYKKYPTSHPDYAQEWTKYYNGRKEQMDLQGIDITTCDLNPEWFEIWGRLVEQLAEGHLACERKALREKHLNLPLQESTEKHLYPPLQESTEKHLYPPLQESTEKHLYLPLQEYTENYLHPPFQESTKNYLNPPLQESTENYLNPPLQEYTENYLNPPFQESTENYLNPPLQEYTENYLNPPLQESTENYLNPPLQESTENYLNPPLQESTDGDRREPDVIVIEEVAPSTSAVVSEERSGASTVHTKNIMQFIADAAATANNSTQSRKTTDTPVATECNFKYSVISTLKLLNELDKYLDDLGPHISSLLFDAVNTNINKTDPLNMFKNVSNIDLIESAMQKIITVMTGAYQDSVLDSSGSVCVQSVKWLLKESYNKHYCGLDLIRISNDTNGCSLEDLAQKVARELIKNGDMCTGSETLFDIIQGISKLNDIRPRKRVDVGLTRQSMSDLLTNINLEAVFDGNKPPSAGSQAWSRGALHPPAMQPNLQGAADTRIRPPDLMISLQASESGRYNPQFPIQGSGRFQGERNSILGSRRAPLASIPFQRYDDISENYRSLQTSVHQPSLFNAFPPPYPR